MVRCPKCGKMNQDSSRFCNQCGTTLPQTRTRCPQCGLMNPIGNAFCSRCNTRLHDSEFQLPEQPKPPEETPVGVKGISLPTLPVAGDGTLETTELPDWLLELTEQSLETPADALEPTLEEPFLDWLSDLEDDTAGEVAGDATGRSTADAPVPDGVAPSATMPDWFDALPEEDEEAGAAEAEVETPSSLAGVDDEPALDELPDWLLATATPTSPGDVPSFTPWPEWLSKNAEEPTPGQEETEQELPGWLLQSAEAPPSHASPAAHSAEEDAGRVVPLPFPEPEEEPVSETSAPDWLAALYPAEEPEPQEAVESQAGQTASSLPDWLMGISEEEEVEPQAAATEPEAETVPDWLMGIYDDEEVEPPAAATEPGAETVPDWLMGIYDDEEAEPPDVAPSTEPEAEAVLGDDVPDWFADVDGKVEEARPLAAIFTVEPEEEEPALEADIPDWLAGIMVEEPVLAQPQTFEQETESGQADVPATDDIPDWLKGMTPPDDEAAALEPAQSAFVPSETLSEASEDEAPALEAGEIPDWIEGLSPTAPGAVEEEAAFFDRVSGDESLVRAEVPSWLQGLRPPGTGPLPSLPEVAYTDKDQLDADIPLPQEGGLVRAEIPDWVQQYRPSADGEVGEESFLEPSETDGPLAGLRGMLPSGPLMDMPADFEPVSLAAKLDAVYPESIVAQAQLWQRLLEQPRSVPRPVAQHRVRSGRGQQAMRWIVAVVLLAVTALGLLWGEAPLSQALSRPHIERFSRAIDALQTGDTVIVAVEYGPAEAGEMTPLARAVVQHLADRNVQITMVSTLPEGAGLIHGLLEPQALVNHLAAGKAAYLPGSSSGVAQFLSEPAEAKMLIVLAGRAERLRWWVEQNNAQSATSPPLPVNVGVNAATAPLMMPYLETLPVVGWVVGLPDLAAYQEFRGLTSGALNSQLDALMLAHWAALALLLFGLFYYLALGKKGAS